MFIRVCGFLTKGNTFYDAMCENCKSALRCIGTAVGPDGTIILENWEIPTAVNLKAIATNWVPPEIHIMLCINEIGRHSIRSA